jgi:hypothetical protein
MARKRIVVPAIIAAAGLAASIMAVGPQTTQDRADGNSNRLVINGQPLFISGMNIAWDRFANDVGDQKISSSFVNYFKQIKGSGGNAVRWWLHTDAQNDPKINSNGQVTGIGSYTIRNMQEVLDSAYAYGIVVSMCLFSFDLLQGDNKSSDVLSRNEKFLTVEGNLDTYITNALKPILAAVGNHPAIMCWEVFNEPEGMTSDVGGWSTRKIPMSHVLRFTAKIAAEVHRSTKKMASTGIHEFGKMKTYYSDAKLKQASGTNDALAYLDFYMAHYYPEYVGTGESPFHHPASFWNMDRPVLIGEFPARSWGPGTGYEGNTGNGAVTGTAMTITAAYEYAYDNGYCGAMSWSMTDGNKSSDGSPKFGNFSTTQPALQNLYNKHKTDIEVDRNVVIEPPPPPGSNLVMKLALTNLPKEGTNADGGPWNELFIEDATHNFSGKTNFTFKMYIAPGSGKNLMIVPVVKMGNDWTWSPAQTEQFMLTNMPQGEWVTITIPISKFVPESGSPQLSQVKGIVLQYFAKDNPYTGTIYFDDVKIDNTVLYDFNELYSEWATGADGASVSIVSSPGGSTSVFTGVKPAGTNRAPMVAVKGRVLNVAAADSDVRLRMVNMRGKVIANFSASGNSQFSLANIPAGRYIVETRAAGKRAGSTAVIVR